MSFSREVKLLNKLSQNSFLSAMLCFPVDCHIKKKKKLIHFAPAPARLFKASLSEDARFQVGGKNCKLLLWKHIVIAPGLYGPGFSSTSPAINSFLGMKTS